MMRDVLVEFQPFQAPAISMVGAAGVNIQVGNFIDILGVGAGSAPPNIIGNVTLFGMDPGIGIWAPEIEIVIGVAFTTANSATANFAVQYAPDTGAAGNYQPGTWETAAETGPKAASECVPFSASSPGLFRLKMPPTPPLTQTPRFARMLMQVPSATNFTAGTVTFAGILQGRDDLQNRQAPANFVVR